MKQTTKNILGVGAIILLSSGVAGLTTYKLLQSNRRLPRKHLLMRCSSRIPMSNWLLLMR